MIIHRTISLYANLKGCDPQYRTLIGAAIRDMEMVWGDPIFFDILVDEIENSNGLEGETTEWKNKTPLEIYNRLCGYFNATTAKWHKTLEIQTYYSMRRVIGYGLGSDDIIRVNTKYLANYTTQDPYDRREVGSNLTHEEGHNCGFDHDYSQTARRKNSIAYLLNRVYERAYKIIIIDNNPTRITIEVPTVTPAPIPVEVPSPLPLPRPVPPVGPVLVKYYTPWYKRMWNWIRGA